MGTPLDRTVLVQFVMALFIGALVGAERERKRAVEENVGIGGIRTFILLAQAGALSAWLSQLLNQPLIFLVSLAVIGAAVVAGYVMQVQSRPNALGLTTEVAAISVFLLGGACLFDLASYAVVLAIAMSVVLAFKQPIHGLVHKMGADDLYAILKLCIASFIVLPLLPNRTVDPWDALNPYKLWWLVILISGLSLIGYVAVRWLGATRGTALTGLFGGLASSTAVTLAFARRSRDAAADIQTQDGLAIGILLAWAIMFPRAMIAVAVVNAGLLPALLAPFAVMTLLALAVAVVLHRCSSRRTAAAGARPDEVSLTNPFSLMSATKFALFFAVVLVVVKLAQRSATGGEMLVVAGLAGLTDVDAISLSLANLPRIGGDPALAVTGIVVAALANTASKSVLTLMLAAKALKLRILVAGAVVIAGGIASLFWL
jgi:uncharacterized membrane protein (DUF4010 family)